MIPHCGGVEPHQGRCDGQAEDEGLLANSLFRILLAGAVHAEHKPSRRFGDLLEQVWQIQCARYTARGRCGVTELRRQRRHHPTLVSWLATLGHVNRQKALPQRSVEVALAGRAAHLLQQRLLSLRPCWLLAEQHKFGCCHCCRHETPDADGSQQTGRVGEDQKALSSKIATAIQ